MPITPVNHYIYLRFFITSWCFPDIYVHKNCCYLIIGQPLWQPWVFIFYDCNNPLIITHCCSNESKSNISLRTLINDIHLAHCAAWALSPSIWKHRYYFPGEGSVDYCGVVVVVIVSQNSNNGNYISYVFQITVNHHYLWHPHYHYGWCFYLI